MPIIRGRHRGGAIRAVAAAGALALCGCGAQATGEHVPEYSRTPRNGGGQIEYVFGVPPVHNPVHLFEIYQPLMEIINAGVTGFQVKIETAPDHASYQQKLISGHLQFAILDPHLVIGAERRGYKPFARVAERIGGLIVVRKDSPIHRATELKHRVISFATPDDFASTMLPKLLLKNLGLNVEREAQATYVGSPESAAMNVYLGLAAAGGMSVAAWQALARSQPDMASALQVRWRSETYVGPAVLAQDAVPQADRRAVGAVLETLHTTESGRAALSRLEVPRFEAATPGSYDGVWEFLGVYRAAFGPAPGVRP
ncbi:MAG: phosphate/phosphite/phosphonate ABC transporter substrate-binding protein [Acidobacteria bacterium]|nr:phosphate/phosphite/phosphonate ABC transporter substrate-binding protein [Acidobacteriota bacterium]